MAKGYRTLLSACLVGLAAFGFSAGAARAGVVTAITLGDFANPTALDFNSAPLGTISGTSSVFTDFGITQAAGTGSSFTDTFGIRTNSSRALWFDSNGLVIVDPGAASLANSGQSFTFDFATTHNRFGFGTHDQNGLDLTVTFFNGASNVGSIGITTTTADLSSHFLANTDAFDRVAIDAGNSGGFAIDNLTLEATAVPAPATLGLFGLGLAGLGLARRRRAA